MKNDLLHVIGQWTTMRCVVFRLQIAQNTRERCDADSTSNEDGMTVVVETLGGCSIWSIHTDFDPCRLFPVCQFFQRFCPVTTELDVKLDIVSDAFGDGERVPLPERKCGNLEEGVLTCMVVPESSLRDGRIDFDSVLVENGKRCWDVTEADQHPTGAFNEDEQGGECEEVAEHWPLEQCSGTVSAEEGDHGVHE